MGILGKGVGLAVGGGAMATIATYLLDLGDEDNGLRKLSKLIDPDEITKKFEELGIDGSVFAKLGAESALPIAAIIATSLTRQIPGLKSISDIAMIPAIALAIYNVLQAGVKGEFNSSANAVANKLDLDFNLTSGIDADTTATSQDLVKRMEELLSQPSSLQNNSAKESFGSNAQGARAQRQVEGIIADTIDGAATTENEAVARTKALMASLETQDKTIVAQDKDGGFDFAAVNYAMGLDPKLDEPHLEQV